MMNNMVQQSDYRLKEHEMEKNNVLIIKPSCSEL